jgi:hypothetical protein
MGTLDEVKAAFGDDFFTRPSRGNLDRHNWHELCTCGHLDRYHSETVGGAFKLPPSTTARAGGQTFTTVHLLNGCVGAVPYRGAQSETVDTNRETMVTTRTLIPTCPCTEFRPVAKVDRPNRMFSQRIPADLGDRARHPFMLGIRALSTFLSKRRAALADPSWPTVEFDRRFVWLDGARVCGISKCKETDDVWPMFVHEDRSELRCPKHR